MTTSNPIPETEPQSTLDAAVLRTASTRTEVELRTAGQRRVNLIWEYTQATIALTTVAANILYIFLLLFIHDVSATATTAAVLLSNAFFLVIGFYFGRTNHARIGDLPLDTRATEIERAGGG